MHLPKRIGSVGSSVSLVVVILFAALAASPVAQAVSARFVTIYWAQPAATQAEPQLPELYFLSGEAFHPLRPRLAQLGPVTRYNGSSRMELYRRVAGPEGELQYLPVAAVQLPERSTAFVLFLSAGPEGAGAQGQATAPAAGSYYAAAVDISAAAIPDGSIALLNLTGTQLAADIRGDRQALEPSQIKLFNPRGERGDHSLPLKMAVFDNEWKPAYGTVLSILPDQPYLMVFYRSGGEQGAYRLRTFRDIYRLRNAVSPVAAGGMSVSREG